MSANQALLMVLETAEKARDEAMSELESRRRTHEAARQQAQSLDDWRKEYQRRWQTQFKQSGGMEIIRCYQDFMNRLAEAVGEQERRVAQAERHVELGRVELIERERKVAAVARLIDKRQAELLHKQNRQEQKATDEMAARSARLSPFMGTGGSLASGSV